MLPTNHIYIISDLHLGGSDALEIKKKDGSTETVDFQMCGKESRERLVSFIHYIKKAHPGEMTELVINGDFVDFLAEEPVGKENAVPFEDFTQDPDQAVEKLKRIIHRFEEVFEALHAFVTNGHTLTILLGNHDLELATPQVRKQLLKALTKGQLARVEFIYDGEAYQNGNLLVEHGNRYDGWNAVAYGLLRAYHSSVSRNERPLRFIPPPGSRLVAQIMNNLKRHFKFIDLLKPENEAVIPVLAALDLKSINPIKSILSLFEQFVEKTQLQPKPGAVPTKTTHIAKSNRKTPTPILDVDSLSKAALGDQASEETIKKSWELIRQAEADWGISQMRPTATTPIASGPREALTGLIAIVYQRLPIADETYNRLHKTLMAYRQTLGTTFDLKTESPAYLAAAERLADGRRTVVFGHTHLAKRKKLNGNGLYLNTGTWCPVIQLPTDFYSKDQDDKAVREKLKTFVDDLRTNQIDKWYCLTTTFVKATLSDSRTEVDLFEWKSNGKSDGIVQRFEGFKCKIPPTA